MADWAPSNYESIPMVYRFFNKHVLLATFIVSYANFSKAQVALPTEELAPLEIYADRLVQPSEFVLIYKYL